MRLSKFVLCATVLLIAYSVQATTRESLLPEGADIVIRMSNIEDLGESIKETSFWKLWDDDKMQEALGEYDLVKFIKENILTDLNEEQQYLYWEELKMLKGEIAFSAQIIKEEYFLVAEIKEEDFKKSIKMDRRLSELDEENKLIINKQQYQGIDIYSHSYADNCKTCECRKKKESWQAYIDNTLLIGNSLEWLKASIVRVKKTPIKQNKEKTPSISCKITVASLLDKIAEKAEEDIAKAKSNKPKKGISMPEFLPSKIIDGLGISEIKKLYMSLNFYDDKMISKSVITLDKPLKGILSVVDLTPSSTDIRIPYAPEGIISYEVFRINLMALWQQIPNMIAQALPPETATQASTGLMMLSGILGVDLGRDLLANLDTQVIMTYIEADKEPAGVYFLRLKNEVALQNSLQKVFAETGMMRMQLGDKFKMETFRDSSLYEFVDPTTNTTFAFAAEGGYLVLGPGKVVRQYLRAIDSSKAANQAFYKSRIFSELKKHVDAKANGYSAVNFGKYVKMILDMIKDDAPGGGINAMLKDKSAKEGLFPSFDAEKIPSAQYISKFFGPSFGSSVPTGSGITKNTVIYYNPL